MVKEAELSKDCLSDTDTTKYDENLLKKRKYFKKKVINHIIESSILTNNNDICRDP